MKRIYDGYRGREAKGSSSIIKTNEQRKQTMTNEEAEKWIRIFEDWHKKYVSSYDLEGRPSI